MYNWFLNWFGKPTSTFDKETGTVAWICPKCGSFEKELDKKFTGVCSKCRTHCLTEEYVPKPHYKWCWKQNKVIRQQVINT